MNAKELDKILTDHKKWLMGEAGSRAYLRGADEFLDCVDSEVLHKIISEEKRKVAKNMAKLEHYYRRSLGLSA